MSTSPSGASRIRLRGDDVTWVPRETISRAPREGGGYRVLAIETAFGDFLIAGDRLIWTEPQRGLVLGIDLGDG